MVEEYRSAYVYVQNIKAGILSETEDGYEFMYLQSYLEAEGLPISITMPISEQTYHSLIESEPGNRVYYLSAAYDMLPVNIVLPEDKEQLALTLSGKKRRIKKKDFLLFAEKCDITDLAAEKMIRRLCSFEQKFHEECDKSYLSDELKEKTKILISERIEILRS